MNTYKHLPRKAKILSALARGILWIPTKVIDKNEKCVIIGLRTTDN